MYNGTSLPCSYILKGMKKRAVVMAQASDDSYFVARKARPRSQQLPH